MGRTGRSWNMRSGREETGATTATGGQGVRKQWERGGGRGGERKGEVLRGQKDICQEEAVTGFSMFCFGDG